MSATTQERFKHILSEVTELLGKARLVEGLAHSQEGPRKEITELLSRRQQLSQLSARISHLHVADIAKLFEVLPREDRMLLWQLEHRARGGEILMELSDVVLSQLIQDCPVAELRSVLQQLDSDDLSFISEWLPAELLEERLASLSTIERHWVHSSMGYEPHSIGAEMSREMILVRADQTNAEVLDKLRSLAELPEQCDKLFVTDRRGMLVGVLPLQQLLRGAADLSVGEQMAQEVVTFIPEEDFSEAVRAFERYDLISAPVLNERGRPIGRLTVDMVMDVLREDNTEGVLNSAGLKSQEDIFASVWQSARNRWLWLALSLMTAFIASRVIGLFEETIIRFVALAALMPIVAAIGGNTGNQTTTLVVRALALDQINSANMGRLIRKEISMSLLNGAFWGTIVALFALIFYHDIHLSGVIGLAMVLTLFIAALFGLSIPLLLHFNGRDPALGSSVLVTALTDSIGFFIFLGLATIFLTA